MLSSFLFYIYKILCKDGDIMVSMLWANQIILGKRKFSEVPKKLQSKVAELLTDAGCEDLITEE